MADDKSFPMTQEILPRWIQRLSHEKLLMGPREAVQHELETWLDLFFSAATGDSADERELQRLVALHAKQLGYEGRPASAVVLQISTLSEVLAGTTLPETATRVLRELGRVAADAQALGQSERLKDEFHQKLKEATPVFQLGPRVVGCLIGSMRADLIDALFGRLVRRCVGSDANEIVVDVFGAGEPDDRFLRTIKGLIESTELPKIAVTVTGLRDPNQTKEALRAIGVNLERVHFAEELGAFLSEKNTPR